MRSQSGATTEWSYTGEQNDPTGLEYLRARYYDPGTGRFLSQDPVPLLQRYAYVRDNPANLIDPSGLASQSSGAEQSEAAVVKQILDDPCWKTHMFCNHSPLIWKVAFDPALRKAGREIGAVGLKFSVCVAVCVSGTVGIVSDGVTPKGFITLGFAGSTAVSADAQIDFTSGYASNGYGGFGGWSYTGGICAGEVLAGCAETTNNKTYHAGSVSGGLGARIGLPLPPVSINGGASYTWLIP